MKVLNLAGARYFCKGFSATAGPAGGSLRDFVGSHLRRRGRFAEGSVEFDSLRDCLVRNSERSLLLALSHYRRALDLLTPIASPWAAVTMYYGAYFSAHSILGLVGGAIDAPSWVVEISSANPGSQELSVRPLPRKAQSPHKFTGSHRVFWDHFYEAGSQIQPWCPQGLDSPLAPVNKTIPWQIDNRNSVNYDTFVALDSAAAFSTSFNSLNFPGSLRGPMATQYTVTKQTIELALWVWAETCPGTDALNGLPGGMGLESIATAGIRDAQAPFDRTRPLFDSTSAGNPRRLF